MDGSTPQHYTIADFIKWHDDQELVLNPDFQRGSVWPSHARTYLIDSILRGYPIPKLLLRTSVDRNTRRTIRDVVDGQQRLRTIFDFSNNKLILGPKSKEFQGKKYDDLDDDLKDDFLSYKLTCEQLINASDEDVLEVFARINSYSVPVNEPELRNAQFSTPFSALVKDLASELRHVWKMGVLTDRELVRMADQSTSAELLGFLERGVVDGAESDITKLYEENQKKSEADLPSTHNILSLVEEVVEYLEDFAGQPIIKRPHFLMAFAAFVYLKGVLPEGKINLDGLPPSNTPFASKEVISDQIIKLNNGLDAPDESMSSDVEDFTNARATTHRMRSRQVRFEKFVKAFTGNLI